MLSPVAGFPLMPCFLGIVDDHFWEASGLKFSHQIVAQTA